MSVQFLHIQEGQKVKATFFDYEVKIVSAPDDRVEQREGIIAQSFTSGYVLQALRLTPNIYAVIGASEEMIKDIYASFKGRAVTALIPYGMAIRAFCAAKGMPLEKLIVVVVEFAPHTLVTIIDGLCFSTPRRLGADNLAVEIKRTLQNYFTQYPQAQEKEVHLVSSKDFSNVSLALEGLKAAQFGIHFDLPQEVIKQKRRKAAGRRIKAMAVMVILFLLGVSAYAGAWVYQKNQQALWQEAQKQNESMLAKLRRNHQLKVSALLKQYPHSDYFVRYYQFLRSLPDGYVVKDLSFIKLGGSQWQMEGIIYPANPFVHQQRFKRAGTFANAQSIAVSVDKVLGEKIVLQY